MPRNVLLKIYDFINLKDRQPKSKRIEKVIESALLSFVASKLKDQVLFPRKVEDAKAFLRKVKVLK